MKLIAKITFLALSAAILCLPLAFAEDPLDCKILSGNDFNFGKVDIHANRPIADTSILIKCNRKPQNSMDFWCTYGDYGQGNGRRLKRTDPSSDKYLDFGVWDTNNNYVYGLESEPSIKILPSCFMDKTQTYCDLTLVAKLSDNTPYPDFYAGTYTDTYICRIRYMSEY